MSTKTELFSLLLYANSQTFAAHTLKHKDKHTLTEADYKTHSLIILLKSGDIVNITIEKRTWAATNDYFHYWCICQLYSRLTESSFCL